MTNASKITPILFPQLSDLRVTNLFQFPPSLVLWRWPQLILILFLISRIPPKSINRSTALINTLPKQKIIVQFDYTLVEKIVSVDECSSGKE